MPAPPRLLPACVLLLVVAASPACTADAAAPRLAARDLLADPVWDDGRAEFSVYEGTIERYGQPRPLTAKLIVVKEDMDRTQRVKSEAGPAAGRTRTVIKQNYLHDFTTGTYDYHQMSTTFLDRATGGLEKLAMSSTEGCGITFVQVLPGEKGWRHVSHSYWDGEADREQMLALRAGRTAVAADALPLWLRRLDLGRAQSFAVDLLPSQLAGRVRSTAFVPATIEVAGRADGYGLPVVVRRATGERLDRYWFDREWPHGLARFEGGNDPTTLVRVKTMRLAYWEETAPGDERLLAP